METSNTSRRAELMSTTIRRLLRRGARTKISKMLAKVRPEDIAVMLRAFTPAEQFEIFRLLIADHPQAATDVLIKIDPQVRLAILEELSTEQVGQLLELAAVDDAVFLLDSLPSELKEKMLEIIDLQDRFAAIQAHLTYGADSAGRIMDTEFVALDEQTTAGEAIAQVRKIARDVEMITYLYVIDKGRRLLGVTPLRQLLLADPEATLYDIMNAAVIKVHTDTDQEEVARLAARYDLLAIPVTDDDGKLKGIVTVDDIIDVFKEEATEDFFKMAGTSEEELVYQDRSFRVAGIRLPWIVFNLIGLMGAGYIATLFEKSFDQIALLIGAIPVIMGMAGNIGSQTSTIAVRGLATGRLTLDQGRVRHFLWQQLKVGLVLAVACSALLAAVGVLAAVFFEESPYVAMPVAISLFFTVLLASMTGVVIPVVFQRIGFDPAVASGPLVTTANDFLGVLIYFGLARLLFQLLPV